VKKLFEPYELSRTELEAFKELTRSPETLSELSRRIEKTPQSVTVAVKALNEKGLVDLEKKGAKKIIEISQSKHAQLLRQLFLDFSHVPWQELLSFSGIIPLFESKNSPPSGASRTTYWRALRNAMAHGIITKDEGKIAINPRFEKLDEFVREFENFNNVRMASMISNAAALVWSQGSRFIVRIPHGTTVSDSRFMPTATTRLPQYGIPLISNVEYLFFSPASESVGPEETVVHTLLIDGVTNITLALMLIVKARIDHQSLLRVAEKYGQTQQVEAMLRFLESRERDANTVLPTWEEFADKAGEYGIKV
jgi:DNA-binding transcriptional ArsR family regulator